MQEFVFEHPGKSLTKLDLCKIAHTSERTLEYAFKSHYGVSPSHYLKLCRLNSARAALRASAPRTEIGRIANRFGFWHMGHFARAYQQLFGELPSQTLGAPRAVAASTGADLESA